MTDDDDAAEAILSYIGDLPTVCSTCGWHITVPIYSGIADTDEGRQIVYDADTVEMWVHEFMHEQQEKPPPAAP